MELTGKPLALTILGQMPSGKNQVQMVVVRRRIMKYPNALFKKWRADAYRQIAEQRAGRPTIVAPCAVAVTYVPGDGRRRDVPGIMDALCHLLEWCPVHGRKKTKACGQSFLADDSLLTQWLWKTAPIDRANPRLEIQLAEVASDA